MSAATGAQSFRRLLVGFDGSPGAHDALALAKSLSGSNAEIVLVEVDRYSAPDPATIPLIGFEAASVDADLLAAARAGLDSAQVEPRCYYGISPARVLSGLTEEEEFDLVVVGSPHRGLVGRALLGSVANGLLHGARVPTIIAPRGYAEHRHGRPGVVAVPYNGMPESERALRQGEALARSWGAELRILTVASIPLTVAGMLGYVPPMPGRPDEVLREGIASVQPGLPVEGRELEGASIANAIVDACGDADVLVCGSRGYGPFSRVMIGSVSRDLIHEAPCPVMVVPRPTAGDFGGRPAKAGTPAPGLRR